MRNTLFLFLAQTRLFWKVKRAFSRLAFINYRVLFRIKHWRREKITTIKFLGSLLRLILGQLLWALVIASLLQFSNPYFVSWLTKQGLTISEVSNYGTLLAAFISTSGIFIGFYYAAISSIGSAIYAEVSNDIRVLLAQEQAGNAYMRSLAVLTFVGVCLLAFHAAGLEPVILSIPLLILCTGFIIIGFVRLGARAFSLSDPTALSGRLFEQLERSHLQVQVGGYRWSDRSFQNYAHRSAQKAIETLTAVSEIAEKKTHLNGRPFVDLCKHLLVFLRYYETGKKLIPTSSLWYEKQDVHPVWYRARDTETSLAHDTAAILQPRSVSNPRWIESTVLPIVKRCLEINIRNKRYALVNELLDNLDTYIQQLTEEHQVESAFNLIDDIFSRCERLILSAEDRNVVEESLEHMRIYELLATMPINALLAYIRTIESYGRDVIFQRIRHITWKSEKSIYKAGFAVHVLEQLEWLRPRLEFEQRVEGCIVSPIRYLGELIAQKEAENLRTAMICFYEKVGKFYEHGIETARSSQHPWSAAIMIARELEYWNKLDVHTNALNQLWSDLNSIEE